MTPMNKRLCAVAITTLALAGCSGKPDKYPFTLSVTKASALAQKTCLEKGYFYEPVYSKCSELLQNYIMTLPWERQKMVNGMYAELNLTIANYDAQLQAGRDRATLQQLEDQRNREVMALGLMAMDHQPVMPEPEPSFHCYTAGGYTSCY